MKYRGKVEFLPQTCSVCLRPRQLFGLTGGRQAIIPCADPGCDGSVGPPGAGHGVFYEDGDGDEGRRIQIFGRRAGPNGWEWFKEGTPTP